MIDDFGWLEPQLALQRGKATYTFSEALHVFVDDTMNRESGFLEPVVRYARWERDADVAERREIP